jgi:hypothetical protein
MKNNYKIGDWVWIREDIRYGQCSGDNYFVINRGEVDVRGQYLQILNGNKSKGYNVEGYSNLHHWCIDHEKTSQGFNQTLNYEIY